MAMKMSLDEISERIRNLEGWELAINQITKTFKFEDFKEAMDFVNDVAIMAEEARHHPDISINYNKVTLTLFTHSEGHLTEKDFRLAARIEELGGV
jgi:4a-hydroxytetrahydrobiopterin dehydratase